MSDLNEQNVEENTRDSYLPVALFFVSVVALVKAWMESGADQGRVLTHFLGPAASIVMLASMALIGAVWFLKGRIDGPFRKILAIALVTLPLAGLLSTVQGASAATPVGGTAGAHLATVFLSLPTVVGASLAGLLVLVTSIMAWRLAFQPPAEADSPATALSIALARTDRDATASTEEQQDISSEAEEEEAQAEIPEEEEEEPELIVAARAHQQDSEALPAHLDQSRVLAGALQPEPEVQAPTPLVELAQATRAHEIGELQDEPAELDEGTQEGAAYTDPMNPVALAAAAELAGESETVLLDDASASASATVEVTEIEPASTEFEDTAQETHEPEEQAEEQHVEFAALATTPEAGSEAEEEDEELDELEDDAEEQDEELDELEDDAEEQDEAEELAAQEEPSDEATVPSPILQARQSDDWASWEEDEAPRSRPRAPLSAKADDDDEIQPVLFAHRSEMDEDTYRKAVALVVDEDRCTQQLLQRSLSLSFSDATAMIERMYDEGLVGPPTPTGGRREVLAQRPYEQQADA